MSGDLMNAGSQLAAVAATGPSYSYPWSPDGSDGTYRNPILFADYSDPDVLRHGDDFWMTASSFNCTPGLPILHSTDLVNWSDGQNLLVSTSAQANYPVTIDFDGGDYGDSDFDRLYSNGKSYLFYRKSIASGHTRITRRKITVTNYPADPPSSSNPG